MSSNPRSDSNPTRARRQADRQLFDAVTRAYSEYQEYAPVVASNCDPLTPMKKRTFNISDYLCDIDLATKRALQSPELYDAWHKVVAGEQVPQETAARIIAKCAAIYRQRGLRPCDYFHAEVR